MRQLLIAGALALALGTGGCADVAAFTANTAASVSTELPSQVTTLAEADQTADLLVIGTRTAVDAGKLDLGTLNELQALRAGLRAALDVLHGAHDRGENLNFAAFNAALQAYRAYAVTKGIAS